MRPFRVIPVIDLRHGAVVRARAGERDAYAPIRTPLASGSAPADVVRGLVRALSAAYPADTLYVADLDAIVDGAAPDLASLHAIRAACPDLALWVDAGFSTQAAVAGFLAAGLGRPVIGSESQAEAAWVHALGPEVVLSLDSRGGDRLGPDALHDQARHWPDDVIVMTLARVGVGAGPDLAAIADAVARAPHSRVHAAGGVRGAGDLTALAGIGAAGALIASAIHDGSLQARGAPGP